MTTLLLLGTLALLIAIGVPIAFSVGLSAVSAIIFAGVSTLKIIPTQLYDGVARISLMAIPMFALMGEIMRRTSLGKQLINIGYALAGWVRGGLGMASIVTCMMFGTISGSSVACAAALGGMMIPQMEDRGYNKDFAGALMSSASSLSLIVPPSSLLIAYAVIAQVSVTDLFVAAIIPGAICSIALMVVCYVFALKLDLPTENSFSIKKVFISIKDGFGALLIPIVIFGGIFSGVFTPVEAAAISAIVAAISGRKEIKIRDIPDMLIRTAVTTSLTTFLVATSYILAYVFTYARIPNAITAAILGLTSSKVGIFLLINVLLLALGCVLHGTAIAVLVTPLALPLMVSLGMNPIHFGIVLCVAVAIGQQTPPVASVLIAICSLTGSTIQGLWPYLKWFIVSLIMALLMLTYFPVLSLCLL